MAQCVSSAQEKSFWVPGRELVGITMAIIRLSEFQPGGVARLDSAATQQDVNKFRIVTPVP